MRRLYFRIYAYFLGILLLFGVLTAVVWHAGGGGDEELRRLVEGTGALVVELLPPPGAPRVAVAAAVDHVAGRLGIELALFDAGGAPLAASGPPLPAPDPRRTESGWMHGAARAYALRLPDGRWLVARDPHRPSARWLWLPVLMLVAIAIGAHPLARRITRRLERLRARVEALGEGDLGARVEVEGRDEVGDLARSFNRAAERIERLVDAQRTMLASASHELRTPLARIRMAIELLAGGERPELRARVERDVAELDGLIDELLLASRLETDAGAAGDEEVDLLAVLAEEAARFGLEAGGEAALVRGDARLLRHLARNLLENARRHGGTGVEARVAALPGGGARLSVCDDGPGIPEAERERVFEPFYRPAGMRETGEGVGLGLHLVRQIARRHGAAARCRAREGGGACFEVEFPAPRAGG